MSDIKNFGWALLRRLELADMSARKLASRSGVSAYAIHTYINGGVVPSMKTLRRLGAVLPELVDDWGDAVAEYHRQTRIKVGLNRRANAAAAAADKPWAASKTRTRPSRYGPPGSLAEICRAARREGLTYVQYVAAHSVGADLQRRNCH